MKYLFKDTVTNYGYTMILAFVFLVAFLSTKSNTGKESITTTKVLNYNQDTTDIYWTSDTIKFTFVDSTMTITTKTENKTLKIKELSLNDDSFKEEDGILCDIYEFEEKLTLYIDKNPDNGQILQLILWDWNTGKSYTYRQ